MVNENKKSMDNDRLLNDLMRNYEIQMKEQQKKLDQRAEELNKIIKQKELDIEKALDLIQDQPTKSQYHLTCGIEDFDFTKVKPIKNRMANKPEGGLWLSQCKHNTDSMKQHIIISNPRSYEQYDLIPDKVLEQELIKHPEMCGGSEWTDFLQSEWESHIVSPCYLIKINPSANIKELRNQKDIEKLAQAYEQRTKVFKQLMEKMGDFNIKDLSDENRALYRNKFRKELDDMEIMRITNAIDFEQMAKDGIDGIHLTQNGNSETRGASLSGKTNGDLYGWDVESTLILPSTNKKINDLVVVLKKFNPPQSWSKTR